VTQTATSPQRKPLLDEASFQQLLSAAYVLQEHNDRWRSKEFHEDFAKNLSAIVETQKLIQTLQLDLAAAAELVAERVQKITNASGTAIGIIEKGHLFYRAGTGSGVIDVGTRVAPDSVLSADCLSKGSALNYPDVTANSPGHAELFRDRDVKAFIAVPVHHAGQVAGVLELRFARANSFREADLRTAELMAGLLSEAMVTAARMKWKEALASERQSMLEALERIKPQIERLGTESPSLGHLEPPAAPPKSGPLAARSTDICSACGSRFFGETESFCGICGTARPAASPHRDVVTKDSPTQDSATQDSQGKVDSPWLVPYGQESPANGNSYETALRNESAGPKPSVVPPSLQELIALSTAQKSAIVDSKPDSHPDETPKTESRLAPTPLAQTAVGSHLQTGMVSTSEANAASAQFEPPIASPAAATPGGELLRIVPVDLSAPAGKIQPYPWGSAKKAQQWLETVKTHQGPRAQWLAEQWQRRRANIYVGLAALILLIVITGWGIRPATTAVAGNASPAPNSQHQAPPQPNLTLFEKLLINLGLAEAPPAPANLGNPEAQVWVDVHTALYHCPGSDLYGKTADGRFTTQKDAQQDQFEPANRKVCQ
jgi:GAF domain-containing protein